MEEVKKNIYQRINAVMQEVDYIQKEAKKVAGQYRYASHDAVTARLHEPLTRHGIVVLPTIKERKQEGNRTDILLSVKFVNMDDAKDFFEVEYMGYGIDSGDKGPGKAISYAFKYALLKTFCLETGDDPDHDQKVEHKPNARPAPTQDQVESTYKNFMLNINPEDYEICNQYLDRLASHFKLSVYEVIKERENEPEKFLPLLEKFKAGKRSKR